MLDIIKPNWKVPEHIRAFATTRIGGYSEGKYSSFNLALHVEDDPQNVENNRSLLKECLDLPQEPLWLNQTHGNKIVCADTAHTSLPEADGSFAKTPNKICIIMTADCLPVLLTNKKGSIVAALHCGWRGLFNGIIHECIKVFTKCQDDVIAWLGPAISAAAYEVNDELKENFEQKNPLFTTAFKASKPGHWYMDLYLIAKIQLQENSVKEIYGGQFCTYNEDERFYSYRRDQGRTGRMATGIWISRCI